ncbi:MAG: histidine kinase [Panacagrimonas sp.]
MALALTGWVQAGPAIELAPGMEPIQIVQVQVLADAAETPPADAAPWQATALPDRWSRSRPGYGGTVWYRVVARFEKPPVEPWALMLPKVSMNADLWVNGVLMGRIGRMDEPFTRHWNTPLLFQTPQTAWRAGDNLVQVRVKAHADSDGGLGRILIGPAQPIAEIFRVRVFWQSTLVSIANISIFALSLFFVFVWVRRRQEVHYGYFAFGTFFWGIANTNMVLTDPPLSDPAWEWLAHVAIIWAFLLLALFGLRFARRRLVRLELGTLVFALMVALLSALIPESWRRWTHAALLLPVFALGIWAMVVVAKSLGSRPYYDYLLFAAAAAITVGIGAHDWLQRGGYLPYEHPYALPFMAPVLLGTMAWLVAGEFARAQRGLAQLNQELGARVEEREKQLRDSYARLGESERERAVVAERARILRDMHDGVGAHLSAAIRQIEAGGASSVEVAQTLRDSLDQLKLSVDAMTLPSGDVNALLASMRYRLQPRIQAADLNLEWDVDALPTWQSDSSTAMRHLQYMLFEMFSNALQHAHARTLQLSAHAEAGASIVIALSDDGQGFQVPPEQALRSLRERARLVGAELSIDTGAAGSCVRMVLPFS